MSAIAKLAPSPFGVVLRGSPRVVTNLASVADPNLWSDPSNVSIQTLTDTDGSTFYRVTATAGSAFLANHQAGLTTGHTLLNSLYVRRNTGTGRILMYLGTNATTENAANAQELTYTITSSWQRFKVTPTAAAATSAYYGLVIVTSGDVVDLKLPMMQDVNGVTYPFAGEYVAASGSYYYNVTNTGVCLGDSFSTSLPASDPHFPTFISQINPTANVTAKGVGGNTLTDILARVPADLVALGPLWATLQGGINGTQVTGGIISATADPNSAMQSLYTQIVQAAFAANIRPILTDVGPFKGHASWSASKQTWLETQNAWRAAYAAANGYAFFSMYDCLVDPSVPYTLLPAYDSGDHLHPSSVGYAVLATGYNALIGAGIRTRIRRH